MDYTFVIIFILMSSPSFLLQVCSNSTTTVAAVEEHSKPTLTPPKQTSYFYQEPQGNGTYEFGYSLEDKLTKNTQFRNETKSANGTVIGSYGFLSADGLLTVVNYVADLHGYRIRRKQVHSSDQMLSTSKETKQGPSTSITTTTTPASKPSSSTTAIPELDLTSGTLPPLIVDTVMDKFHIDLSPDASPVDILHPNISDIISGKVSSTTDTNNTGHGFKLVQNFIPSNFPIAPFKLPTDKPSQSMYN